MINIFPRRKWLENMVFFSTGDEGSLQPLKHSVDHCNDRSTLNSTN